jgi:peptidyl-tRNA hydrolase, PTH1 family
MQALDFFKLTPEHVLVLADDVALDYGTLKLKPKGGAGGHNGLKSMQSHLKTQDYARLRIGVGAPKRDLVEHVLGEFTKSERKELDMFVAEAASVVEHWIREDSTDIVMTAANGKKAV